MDAVNKLVVAKGWGQGVSKMHESGQKLQTSSYKMERHGNVMYNVVTTVNNTMLHFFKLLGEQILKVLITRKKNCDYMLTIVNRYYGDNFAIIQI